MEMTLKHEDGIALFYDHASAPLCALDEGPLLGLRHRTVIDASNGAAELAIWQEEHLPGFHVPPHLHDCEEVISVLDGEIEAEIDDERFPVRAGQSFLIPAWRPHGFRVTGDRAVKLLAIFSSCQPGIYRFDGTASVPPWCGGASDHLEFSAR